MAYEIKYRSEDEMKDSGIEWLGKVPKECEILPVKRIFKLKRDKSFDKEPKILSLTQKGIIERDISNNEGQIAASYEGYVKVEVGDFVLNPMDLVSGYVDKSRYEGVISPAYITFTNIDNRINLDFYKFYFQMLYHHKYLFPFGEGVSFVHRWTLKNEIFLNYPILKNEKINQQKIANFLDIKIAEFDTIISKKELLIEKLEEAKKSLISEVVTGKVKIVDGELVDRKPEEMKDSGVKWLGMIPKDWELSKLKYVSNIIMGQSPNSDDINQEGIGIPFLQGKAEFGYKNPKAINFCNKPKKMSRVNDILISVRAPVGDLNISDNVYCIGRGLASIGSNRSNKYLYYTLLTYKDVLKSIATGSTFEAITIEQLKNVIMLNPDDLDQQKTANFLDIKASEFNSIITKTQKQITKLKEAKQSLISEAVTGKIDLRDWEIIETGGR